MKEHTYADSGVNIELGNNASRVLYEAAKQTHINREGDLGELIVSHDDFFGRRAVDISNLPKGTITNMNLDGVGTKIEIAERVGNHRTIAYDLFAMVCDDAVVQGGEPVLIGTVLDVNRLKKDNETYIELIKQLAEGCINAAREANVAIVNGEIAELGNRVNGYGPFNYNWSATVTWFANKDRMFTGYEIKEGDTLVGLRETGFRSNGISLVRRIMEKVHRDEWHNIPWREGNKNLGEMALTPSTIYTRALVEMFGGYNGEPKAEIHGAAHITGGGIPEKLGRMLKPSGLGARIHSPFEPSDFMLYVQAIGNVSDEEAYKTWNMGQGIIIATNYPQKVIDIAKERGIDAKNIGYVTEDPKIKISNEGALRKKLTLTF